MIINPFKIEEEIEELKRLREVVAKKLKTYKDQKVVSEYDISIAVRDCLTLSILLGDLVEEYERITSTILKLEEVNETILHTGRLSKIQRTFIKKYKRNLNESIYNFL